MAVSLDFLLNQEPRIFYPWAPPNGIMNLHNGTKNWVDIDCEYINMCKAKSLLLATNKEKVFRCTSKDSRSSMEVLQLVLESLPLEVASQENEIVQNHLTGNSFDTRSMHPLEIASLLVQSDLIIMTEIDGEYVLTDACVCFPDRWILDEKLGKSIAEIHRPVKHFKKIKYAVNGFMKSMREPKYRFNYTFSPTYELHLPHTVEGKNKYLRVEKQWFFRLPSGAILFTIRTYIQKIKEMSDHVFAPLLDVLEGRQQKTSLGDASGKYDDVKDICLQRRGKSKL